MTVSVESHPDQRKDERQYLPWNELLATISLIDLRRLVHEVWVSRRQIQDAQLKTWLNLAQSSLPRVPGFRPGHYERLPVQFITAPLAQFCLRHPAHAARLVGCWMSLPDHPLVQLIRGCDSHGVYYIQPDGVDLDTVAKGYVDLAEDDTLSMVLAHCAVPASDLWRFQIMARWIKSYFPLQEAQLVENATKVATVLATQQPVIDDPSENIQGGLGAESDPAQLGRRVIPPDKRGGRPRGSTNGTAATPRDDGADEATFSIIAFKAGLVWRLSLETSCEDENFTQEWQVWQGDQSLAPAVRASDQWPLQSLDDVRVERGEETKQIKLRWLNQAVLAFRLSQRDVGRMVSAPSRGAYLLLAPQGWKPAMHCYRECEPCEIPGYAAHFVNLTDENNQIAFDTPIASVPIPSSEPRIWCAGECVEDAEPNRPPVYLGAPPKLTAFSTDDWKGITRVVVVEEGSQVEHRRRFFFDPVLGEVEQSLVCLDEVEGGWFAARLYAGGELIDSVDFRFARGLKSLTVQTDGILPSEGQQVAARVVAIYAQGTRLIVPPTVMATGFHADEAQLFANLSARVEADAGEWRIMLPDGNEMPILLCAPRVWWAFSSTVPDTNEWGYTVPTMCRNDFRAASRTTLWIKAPRGEAVQVGFSLAAKVSPTVDPENGLFKIRLGSLNTDAAVMNRTVDATLCLWVGDQSTLLARVPAEETAVAPAVKTDDASDAATDQESSFGRGRPDKQTDPLPVESESRKDEDDLLDAPRRIIAQHVIDYSYIHQIADNPAYRWYAICCAERNEERLINTLKAQLQGKAIFHDVPVMVFPHRVEISKSRRTSTKLVPLITNGYVFVLMKPGTDLQYYLSDKGATVLEEELPADWLEKIIDFKSQAPADVPCRSISAGQMVLIIDGALKGQMGRVISIDSPKTNAKIEVDFVSRTIPVSIPIKQIAPA